MASMPELTMSLQTYGFVYVYDHCAWIEGSLFLRFYAAEVGLRGPETPSRLALDGTLIFYPTRWF
jgi:hypothetical protein